MLTRRELIQLALALAPGFYLANNAPPARGQDVADLKTQLNSGLKCRRDVEFAFVSQIVQMTNNGDLSVELVKGTFQWARRKKPYPFPYFYRAIRERAAKEGVTIPPLE